MYLSFDVEPDAPPYINTERGLDEGLPRLLEVLDELKVRATFFVLGSLAVRRPRVAYQILERGHELAPHGYDHVRLDRLPVREAKEQVARAIRAMRDFAEPRSFRAPYLKLPRQLLGYLREEGILVDSSVALYKPPFRARPWVEEGVVRLPATVTSSVLRLPWPALRPTLMALSGLDSVVLFLHPWEAVRVRHWRPDIWVGTGRRALENLRRAVEYLSARGYVARTVGEAGGLGAGQA